MLNQYRISFSENRLYNNKQLETCNKDTDIHFIICNRMSRDIDSSGEENDNCELPPINYDDAFGMLGQLTNVFSDDSEFENLWHDLLYCIVRDL